MLINQVFGWQNEFLKAIVATPLIVLGSLCLVLLALGRWLKSVAGEAADAYQLTSEAHFLSQLELSKRRYEAEDLSFLAERVFDAILVAATLPRGGAAEVLAAARRARPDTLRLLLAGHHHLEGAAELVTVCHRVLVAPCAPAAIRQAVLHARHLREVLGFGGLRSLGVRRRAA